MNDYSNESNKNETISRLAILKSIWESGSLPNYNADALKAWIQEMFSFSMSLVNGKVDAPVAPSVPAPVPAPMPKPPMTRVPYRKPEGTTTVESLFDTPQKLPKLTRTGNSMWKTMDAKGNSYMIFDSVIADYATKMAGQMMTAEVVDSPKGSHIVHFSDVNVANA